MINLRKIGVLLPPGEGGPKGRMRDLQVLKIPHPPLRGTLPGGRGRHDERPVNLIRLSLKTVFFEGTL